MGMSVDDVVGELLAHRRLLTRLAQLISEPAEPSEVPAATGKEAFERCRAGGRRLLQQRLLQQRMLEDSMGGIDRELRRLGVGLPGPALESDPTERAPAADPAPRDPARGAESRNAEEG